MQFTPTVAQVAAKEARRIYFQSLWKAVKQMPENVRLEQAARHGVKFVTGHEPSLCNQMLILIQSPKAIVVAGFRQWIENGRCVRKGEKGIMIWVPTGKRKVDAPRTDDVCDEVNFVIGAVFDIGQTDAIPARVDILAPAAVNEIKPPLPLLAPVAQPGERFNPLEIAA
jgi:hypothetical protein